MSEHQKQTAFLKALILEEDTEEHRHLEERIHKAERDERCVNRAMRLVGVLGLLSIAGLGYLAVLLPGFFDNSSHFLIKTFCALALGSSICFVVFLGLWLWQRALVNRALEDGRRCILSEHQQRGQQIEHTTGMAAAIGTNFRATKLPPAAAATAETVHMLSMNLQVGSTVLSAPPATSRRSETVG
jgi:hypothetical protein